MMMRGQRTLPILGQTLLALAIGSATAYAQGKLSVPHPYGTPAPVVSYGPAPPAASAGPLAAGPWQLTTNAFPGAPGTPGNPLLMTDGTVIVQQQALPVKGIPATPLWWKLMPDNTGSYVNGTWSKLGSMQSTYAPLFFASEVLPDGRVVVNGGEFNFGSEVHTTLGAIYYPSFGAWTPVVPPAGFATIGDAASEVLTDGTYFLTNCCVFTPPFSQQVLFNPTPPFTAANWTTTGTNKADDPNEEGWTLLPNGKVLAVDAYVNLFPNCPATFGSEVYDAATGLWSSAGTVPVQLPGCGGGVNNPPTTSPRYELGPQALRPDFAANGSGDNVIVFSGVTAQDNNFGTGGPPHTAIYTVSTGAWTAGPNVPTSPTGALQTLADAPAAVLPSGNVLFAASAFAVPFEAPTNFYEVGPNSTGNPFTLVTTNNTDAPNAGSFVWNFLVLPTGQVLAVEPQITPDVWIYTPLTGAPNASWLPVINTSPMNVTRGGTFALTGTQFGGLTQGASYRDDVQANTNYPIVAIKNMATGHVFYELTSSFTVSTARNAASSTNFTVSGKTETGPGTLTVIANGISSAGVLVNVQ
jgi:hypothetical protein